MTYSSLGHTVCCHGASAEQRRHAPSCDGFGEGRVCADVARPASLAVILREHVKWSRAEGKYDRVGVEPPVHGHRFNECLLRVAEILERHDRLSDELLRAKAEIYRLRNRGNPPAYDRRNTHTNKRNSTRKEHDRT